MSFSNSNFPRIPSTKYSKCLFTVGQMSGKYLHLLIVALILPYTSCVSDTPPWQVDETVYKASNGSVYVIETDKTGAGFQTQWGIVTNAHVVEDLSRLRLDTSSDERYDINAVKRIDCKGGNYLPLSPIILLTTQEEPTEVSVYDWGNIGIDMALICARAPAVRDMPLANGVRIGEKVFAVGRPERERYAPTAGMVTGVHNENGVEIIETAIRVWTGLSGSPLLNENGQVVGIIYGVTHLGEVLAIHVDELQRLFRAQGLGEQK